jgi:hypothetical protein
MSLLHQETSEAADDAARGEEFTKGSSHVVIAAVAAGILVTIAIAVYVIAGQKPPIASGEILAVWAHPQHTETSGLDANGEPMAKEAYDQILVFVKVRLRNQGQQPLFLLNILSNAKLADGIHSCYAASYNDYERVFLAYPNIPVPHDPGLPADLVIQPGQTVEGTFVSAFKMKREDWDARKDLDFSFTFRYQPSLVLAPRVAVTER